MTDGLGTTTWTYGDGLHLTQTVTPYGTVAAPNAYTQTIGYAYDADGRRTTRSLVGTGAWTYGYFDNGQPQTVQTPYGGTTSFSYDGVGRLTRQVNGDGTVRTLGYDAAGQTTDLSDYTSVSQVAHFHYDYTPGGEVARMTQNSGPTTSYSYDGADQLVGEVHAGDGVAYSLGFTYDHNGNRLTQTSGGSVVQQFVYDGHDKVTSGNAGGEVYSYDANGNQTGLNYYGSLYTFTFDDEDRLTAVTNPAGLNDHFAYNGLGQRTAKTDSTGQYALVSDGAAPAAPVLTDGVTVYTPGLSSRKSGNSSEFRHGDLLGSLRFLTDANQTVVGDRLFSAFGATVASDGDPSTPFGWVGDGESQTDADTGLVLMGHRVYDSRLGRFLSQDPAGDGDNWYAYCGNDPIDEADPEGLFVQGMPSTDQTMAHDFTMGFIGGFEFGGYGGAGSYTVTKYTDNYTESHRNVNGVPTWVRDPGSDVYSQEDIVFSTGGSGMFAQTMSESTNPPGLVVVRQLSEDGVGVGKPGLQKETEELSRLTGNWGKGTYDSVKECVENHFQRKGADVKAENLLQYLRKAEGFSQNLKNAATKNLENGATRFTKTGKYIIKDIEGRIVSFGKAR